MKKFKSIFFSVCYLLVIMILIWVVNVIIYWITMYSFFYFTSLNAFGKIASLILTSVFMCYLVFFGAIKLSNFLNQKVFCYFPQKRSLLILITIVSFADGVWNMIWLTPIGPFNDMSVAFLKLLLMILAFSLCLVVSPLAKIWNKIMAE